MTDAISFQDSTYRPYFLLRIRIIVFRMQSTACSTEGGREREREESHRFLHAETGVAGVLGRKAELVHHPFGLGALACASFVVDEGLLEADAVAGIGTDRPVDTGGLPESGSGDPVRPYAVPVLPTPQAKEVPFLLSSRYDLCKLTTTSIVISNLLAATLKANAFVFLMKHELN